jgi:cytochrome c-type biogenesis protein CcmH
MTVFVIIAILMVLAAVSAVIVPLLRQPKKPAHPAADSVAMSLGVLREQLTELEREFAAGHLNAESYATEKAELEQRALEDGQRTAPTAAPTDVRRTKLAVAIGVAMPLLVLGIYYAMGSHEALTGKPPAAQVGAEGGEAGHALTQQQIEGMVEKLAERLLDNPNDGQGWHMLARSYAVLGRHAESAAAYGRAVSLLPPDAQLLADYADMLAVTQQRKLQGEPEKLIRQALQIDPRNVKALALSGSVAFERKDFRAAANEWRKILDLVPKDSDISASIRSSIAEAEGRAGGATAPPQTSAANTNVSGLVTLDPALRQKASTDDAVFVFAHAVNGPRMPLAVLRKRVSDLPFEFSLDDSMAMTPQARLSQFDQITVSARISKTGDPLPHSGDLEATPVPASAGVSGLKIMIVREVK